MIIKKLYMKRPKSHFKSLRVISQRSSSSAIKLEPAFLAENEEALLAAGYSKQFMCRRKSGGPGRSGYGRGSQGRQQGRQQQNRSTNPIGSDGKILTCRYCGSFPHLVAKCPHSWENMGNSRITEKMAKVNIAEDEHAILFMGYN